MKSCGKRREPDFACMPTQEGGAQKAIYPQISQMSADFRRLENLDLKIL